MPGIYRLRANDKKFLRFDYDAKSPEQRGEPLLIAPGVTIENLKLTAPKYSSICGHLTDTSGNSRQMQVWFLPLLI